MPSPARNSRASGAGRRGGKRSSSESAAATSTPARAASAVPDGLTLLQARLVEEFLVDGNATAAYERATKGQRATRNAKKIASEMLERPAAKAYLTQLRLAQTKRTNIEADDVINRFWDIATADPNELVEYRRTSCRHCYGADHKYQMTARELEERHEAFRKKLAEQKSKKGVGAAKAPHLPNDEPEFDELGGEGWDPRRPPFGDCPECFGEGVERQFLHDTRTLSRQARMLYAGVKETKDGLEVKMHSQLDALVNVGKLKGLYIKTVEVVDAKGRADRLARARKRVVEGVA